MVNLADGAAELRWFYSRSFLDSLGTQVNWGNGRQGFYVPVPCSIASGLVSVDEDSLLWTTDDAQDPAPQSIFVSAGLFTPRGQLIQQLTIASKPQWVVPSSQAPTTTWEAFSTYNLAVQLVYWNPSWYSAAEVDRRIQQEFATHYASNIVLGEVFTSVPPTLASQPVAWITDDPLVRDAIKLQSVDIQNFSVTPPSDGQILAYNQANDDWEATTSGAGTGNVISNETVSIDSQAVAMSGTGGKTIKKLTSTGFTYMTAGVISAVTRVTREVPTGTINGVNGTFTLAHTPVTGSEEVFLNGALALLSGAAATNAYTIAGAVITHLLPPQTGDSLVVSYWY